MVYDEDPSGATQIYNPDDPMLGGEWSVNVTDDETRTMTGAEVAMEYLRGGLSAEDTYVWRDGMGDWVPLGECAELQEVIKRYNIGQQPPPAAQPQEEDDFGATVMMDQSAPAAAAYGKVDEVSRTMTSPMTAHGSSAARPNPSRPSPAGPTPGGYGHSPAGYGSQRPLAPAGYGSQRPHAPEADPFAAARPAAAASPSVPPGRHRVGERHEASALFNISDLNAAVAARSRPQAAFDDKKSDIDDLLNLGGGMSGGFASAFEPPPIHAPAPPPPPKPVPVVAPAQPMSSALLAAQLEPPKKSRLGLVLGALVGVLLLGGAALAFVLTSDKAETTASNTATAADKKDEASEGKDDEADGDEDQAAKDESADGGATETASDDKKDDTKSTDKATQSKTATKDDKATATKDDKTATKDDKATTEDKPAEDKPADDKAKPAAEFNRDAARSALAGAAGAASGCKTKNGPTGKGQVTVTFAPSGRATQATVGPPFAGTSVGSCAAAAFKSASVPPFSGSAVTVSKSFFIK